MAFDGKETSKCMLLAMFSSSFSLKFKLFLSHQQVESEILVVLCCLLVLCGCHVERRSLRASLPTCIVELILLQRHAQVKLKGQCRMELMKLHYCNLCAGQSTTLPCSSFCHSTVRACFQQHALLHAHWSKFIGKSN